MPGVDTLKLEFPLEFVRAFDWQNAPLRRVCRLEELPREDPRAEITSYVSNKREQYGAYVEYTPDRNRVIVEFSAKVLGALYPEGLSDETVGAAFDRIEQVNGLELDRDAVLARGVVLRADVAANVFPEGGVARGIVAAKTALSWSRKRSDYRFGDSLLLYNGVEEINFYDKVAELSANDPELFEQCAPQLEGALRIEYRAKKKRALCKRYGVQSFVYDTDNRKIKKEPGTILNIARMGQVLNLDNMRSALLDSFDELTIHTTGTVDAATIDAVLVSPLPLAKLIEICGKAYFFREVCGGDPTILETVIREKMPGRRSAARMLKKRVLDAWRLCERAQSQAVEIIQDMRTQLEAA